MRPAHWFLPYDLYERHQVVAQMIAWRGGEVRRILDVGGRVGLLSRFVAYPVVSVNVDGSGDVQYGGDCLPFAPASFDVVTAIDTLEHLPRERRLGFVQDCLRVARRAVILAAPFGSPGHAESEARLNALHTQLIGRPHPYLSEHIAYGLPDWDEVQMLIARSGAAESRLLFAGDYRREARHFTAAMRGRARRGWRARWEALLWHWRSRAILTPLHLSDQPQPYSNRFFMELVSG
ncbi:MAG: hypothetical protein KatS3mg052_0486 [Candidatus Roseilinea sp.]|nr:MAG: hypothetical protein KatS3mg052_0486 [Candidatus Roseilinea sp.]